MEEEWAAGGKSSSARVNAKWTGARFGSGFSLSDTEVEWIVDRCSDCACLLLPLRDRPRFSSMRRLDMFGVESSRLAAGAFKYLGDLNRATVCHHPKKRML